MLIVSTSHEISEQLRLSACKQDVKTPEPQKMEPIFYNPEVERKKVQMLNYCTWLYSICQESVLYLTIYFSEYFSLLENKEQRWKNM